MTLFSNFFLRDRIALCQLWKSIILNDQKKMQYFSKQLGVDGKFTRQILVSKNVMCIKWYRILSSSK